MRKSAWYTLPEAAHVSSSLEVSVTLRNEQTVVRSERTRHRVRHIEGNGINNICLVISKEPLDYFKAVCFHAHSCLPVELSTKKN